ncbi:MAG: tyrosine-type recombinase/integrase [Solirubrobacteraceae bacterium]
MQRGFARKRGATWTAYFNVTTGGRRQQRSKGGFPTKAKALAYLNTVVPKVEHGDYIERSKLTLGEYLLERWLPLMEHSVRPSTWHNYGRVIERHIIPTLGSVPLQALNVDHLDDLYRQLATNGRLRDGQGLSPKSIRHVHTTLHKALRDAERKRLIQRNVATSADPPRIRQSGDREMKTWTASQLNTFLRVVSDHPIYIAFLLAATTGMRRGEVLGLRWGDVDLDNGRLAVRQTLLSINYRLTFGTPKTARGRRLIALDRTTVEALREHRIGQRSTRALLAGTYHDHDLVVARPDGEPVHPDYFSQAFERKVASLELPRIRLHDLRHTHATLGLAAGVPAKIMSVRLGHSTVAFTQDVYMHTIPELEDRAAELVASLVFAPPVIVEVESTPALTAGQVN